VYVLFHKLNIVWIILEIINNGLEVLVQNIRAANALPSVLFFCFYLPVLPCITKLKLIYDHVLISEYLRFPIPFPSRKILSVFCFWNTRLKILYNKYVQTYSRICFYFPVRKFCLNFCLHPMLWLSLRTFEDTHTVQLVSHNPFWKCTSIAIRVSTYLFF